jgi:hypothetical protein
VEKSQFDLCLNILRRFNRAGLLDHLVLIGSWCVVFYEDYFRSSGVDLPSLRTRDIDFLVPRPSKFKEVVDVPRLVEDLGFTVVRNSNGLLRLNHPDLILEFLVPERGAGQDDPVALPKLGMNAVALRFLTLLMDDVIQADVEDFIITLPHPAPFALHKLIIAQRRKNKDKSIKDHQMAVDLLRALIQKGDTPRIQKTFNLLPSPWQKKVLKGLDPTTDLDLHTLLTSPV